jgi:hypothetical protein
MGVSRTDYLMLAVDIDPELFEWDKHEDELSGTPDARFNIVYDGMSGKYCLAGKIVASSDPYEGFEKSVVDTSALDINRADLASDVSEAFGRVYNPDDFKLVLFSHFS